MFVFSPHRPKELRPKEDKSYIFDDVFDEDTPTADIFSQSLTTAIENVINGYNSTVLAYGMTGAGKTYTMFGDIYNSNGGVDAHPGLITLMVKELFSAFAREQENGYQFQLKFSYLEIYNEQIRDLLSPSSTENLMIIEDPTKGVVIPDLSIYEINQYQEITDLIISGNSKRVMAPTGANQFSSRSHAILQLIIEKEAKLEILLRLILKARCVW